MSTNNARPFIKAESSNPNPPTSSGGGSATPCYCGVVIAERQGYIDEDGGEHDMELYYRHCELHDPGKKDYWSISSLGDLMKLTNTTLTKEGRAYWKELHRESDERNPYIAEMECVKAEIRKVDDELNFMGVAKEKMHEWNQQDQINRANNGEGIPLPKWLEKYRDFEKFYERRKALYHRREALYDRKFDLHIAIVNYRFEVNPAKEGGTP